LALVRAEARAPELLALAPFALVRADTAWLLLRGFPHRVGLFAHPPLAGTTASWLCTLITVSAARMAQLLLFTTVFTAQMGRGKIQCGAFNCLTP
jgi:hypothetical protein